MTQSTIDSIGCDLGDRWTTVCILRADDSTELGRVRTTQKAFRAFFERPAAHVVIEVGTHSRWVSAVVGELGHRVTVANPRRVRLISQSESKNDRRDAELLARLGRVDVNLLSPIRHRGADAQADLELIKARDVMVGCRTRLVNHVRSVVKSFGERLPSCASSNFHRKTWEALPGELQMVLKPLYGLLEQLDAQIRQQDGMIRQLAKKYPEVEVVKQPHGVGELTALAFMLTIEDKKRFAHSRAVGAFFGLRPRRSQSGDYDPQLRITKAGDPLVRKLLVNCANYLMGPFGKDSDLRRWGLQLAERGGKNARKRAKIAVARKLAVLLHRLWTTGEVYQPTGYPKLAA
jgi:transposase